MSKNPKRRARAKAKKYAKAHLHNPNIKQYGWHPKSWSKLARYRAMNDISSINNGYTTIEARYNCFNKLIGYSNWLILYRRSATLSRKIKEGKVKNNIELLKEHYPFDWQDFLK